jgi:hypothetical protein
VVGGHHLHDPRWAAKEWADDSETWGKATAKTQGLATQKQNRNGGANRGLASGERRAVSHLVEGK